AFRRRTGKEPILIAGVTGGPRQAAWEARKARDLGYHACLLHFGGMRDASRGELLDCCREVAEILPLIGFYLQCAVGGRILTYGFWVRFLEIERVVAVKVAPFDRYKTLDVVRAIGISGREREVALYTGNDDAFVTDLLTEFPVGHAQIRFSGGLLGQWAVWTKKAVELLERIKQARDREPASIPALLAEGARLTDANGAIFDAANGFAGCIPGIHEVLRRQGLLEGVWCLDPAETLSRWQAEEIERVCSSYPELADDEFVEQHRDAWLA
ncbi:MAG: dihydrodipicolinate synthase family protein, partial [Bacteroidota bacterium]|nr:dihydrodipicolinate synthase family protein [Bacteroidota bacterium]